jgi:hypothetical protein
MNWAEQRARATPWVMTGAKGAACSERDGVIVPRKCQWPDAGIALVTRGGPSFWAHSVVVAYIAKMVKKNYLLLFLWDERLWLL